MLKTVRSPRLSAPPLIRGAGGIDTPLIKGGLRGDRHPPYQGGIKGGSTPPLSRQVEFLNFHRVSDIHFSVLSHLSKRTKKLEMRN
ncbi:MAG: hypothetical protein BEV12_15700 [Microcystis aeruginosa CACIAM 03]|nr:MAG: hypothetical protein BEV12_15700 [Microcystis aeruginosa CACIAM 03]